MAGIPGQGGVAATPAEIAVTLAGAAALGAEFPAAVPDTPANRALFEAIRADIEAMPAGTVADLPQE
jgi:hypothetical protein